MATKRKKVTTKTANKKPTRGNAKKSSTPRQADRAAPAATNHNGAATEPALILLVDDFRDNREMYAEFLTFSGFRVCEAENGREALDRAFADSPDLIVMDLSLPGMDGWEATRRLKADRRTKHIPVMALTGNALASHQQQAKEAGCDAFVTKPCLPDHLVSEVQRMLDERPQAKKRDK